MEPSQSFDSFGAIHIKDVVSQELAHFLTHLLMRAPYGYSLGTNDEQVPNAVSTIHHELVFDTLLESVWPYVEQATGKSLLPTYSYARLYTNGNTLEKHTDRESCEISMTIQLGRSHHYAWPIFMGGKRFDLAEGDGVIYKGCDIEHWRNVCDGPDHYYSGQAFLHFVDANGPFASWANDTQVRNGDKTATPIRSDAFTKFRTTVMENK